MRQVDGVAIDRWKGRFSGTIDEIDGDEFRHDRFVVLLVTARTAAGSTDTMDDGEVVQTMRLKVQDMVPLEGELRDQAVAYMAHGPNQGGFSFGNHMETPKEELKGQQVADYAAPPEPQAAPPDVDPETGEIVRDDEPVLARDEDGEYFDVPVAKPDPVTVRPDDVEPPKFKEAEPVSDPDPRQTPVIPTGNVIGHVSGRPRKDSVLDSFLNEG